MGGRAAVPLALAAWAGVALGGDAGFPGRAVPGGLAACALAALVLLLPLLVLARGDLPRLGALALVLAGLAGGCARGAAHAARQERVERRIAETGERAGPRSSPSLVRLRARVVTPPRREGDRPDATVVVLGSSARWPAGARLRAWLPAGCDAEVGDVVEALARIEAPSGPRVPGAGSARDAARASDVAAHAWVHALRIERARGAWAIPGATVTRWRRGIERTFARGLTPAARELVVPLVTGDRAGLGPDLAAGLQAAGLTHLIALSGLHVVWFAAGAEGIAARLGGGVASRAVAGAFAAVLYALLAGPVPSLVRAAVTGVVAGLARVAGRALDPLQALAVTVLAVLAWAPGWAADLGFQLSCLATAGLVTIGRALDAGGPAAGPREVRGVVARCGRVARAGLAGAWRTATPTVAAQLATLPLVLARFHVLAWTAVLANLVAVPMCGVLLAAAWLGALAEIAWPGAGRWALGACEVTAAAMRSVCDAAARVPGALRSTGDEPATLACAWIAVALLVAAAPEPRGLDARRAGPSRARRLARGFGAGAAVLALALALTTAPLRPPPGRWWLVVLDVGQGEALAVGFRDGWWLVDAGPRTPRRDAGRDAVLPFLRWAGVRRLERLVVTHDDLDHAGGAPAVLAALPVGELVVPVPARAAFGARHRRVRAVARGDTLRDEPPVRVAWPPPGVAAGSDNHGSLVLVMGEAPAPALLAADVDTLAEAGIALLEPAPAGLALLKVAHHGSRTSTSASWLRAMRPRRAAISCGRRNAFGHPHPEVLARLAAAGVRVDRTDLSGSLWYELGPGQPAVIPWRSGRAALRGAPRAGGAQGSDARLPVARAATSRHGIAAAPRRW